MALFHFKNDKSMCFTSIKSPLTKSREGGPGQKELMFTLPQGPKGETVCNLIALTLNDSSEYVALV